MSAPASHRPPLDAGNAWTRPVSKNAHPAIEDPDALKRLGDVDREILSSVSGATLAARVGVAESTGREWIRLRRIPKAFRRAARALILGDLGVIDERFRGWRVVDGHLRAPEGGEYVFSVADLLFVPFARRMIGRLESDLRRAREETRRAVELAQRAHAEPPAVLQVPAQGDWVSGEWRPAPLAPEETRACLAVRATA